MNKRSILSSSITMVMIVLLGLLTACESVPTMRSSIGEAFGEGINVAKVKTLCKMPPGTPITAKYVFLGCNPDQIPVVLDLVCQEQKTITKACAYQLEAFKPAAKMAANGNP
jgi:hypothetical protein